MLDQPKRAFLIYIKIMGTGSACVLAGRQGLVKSTVLLRKIRKRLFRPAFYARRGCFLADAKVLKVKGCFARLAAQALWASHFCLGNKSNQKFLTSARIVRKTGWIVDLTETPLLPS